MLTTCRKSTVKLYSARSASLMGSMDTVGVGSSCAGAGERLATDDIVDDQLDDRRCRGLREYFGVVGGFGGEGSDLVVRRGVGGFVEVDVSEELERDGQVGREVVHERHRDAHVADDFVSDAGLEHLVLAAQVAPGSGSLGQLEEVVGQRELEVGASREEALDLEVEEERHVLLRVQRRAPHLADQDV